MTLAPIEVFLSTQARILSGRPTSVGQIQVFVYDSAEILCRLVQKIQEPLEENF
jgi:hypothetical protein